MSKMLSKNVLQLPPGCRNSSTRKRRNTVANADPDEDTLADGETLICVGMVLWVSVSLGCTYSLLATLATQTPATPVELSKKFYSLLREVGLR